eukprot:CAMPEP_0119380114 /NCGR_PEP_ID=MMETSP1334-20130426/55586_1 /TAXON_ID=127549 /ORGANISM="Calcidiscus leptoporus, Strain RCC1130" /LENGTH=37 /DNA_ID= /DNA_START= /DNA_END= /DNA_ORIENTATION=
MSRQLPAHELHFSSSSALSAFPATYSVSGRDRDVTFL